MKWSLNELTKKKQISFNEELDLRDELLKRSQEILDCQPIEVKGEIAYDDDLFYLDYQIKTVLILPSSRSLKPVEYPIDLLVNEIFATEESLRGSQELLDNDLIIVLDKDLISLNESIATRAAARSWDNRRSPTTHPAQSPVARPRMASMGRTDFADVE